MKASIMVLEISKPGTRTKPEEYHVPSWNGVELAYEAVNRYPGCRVRLTTEKYGKPIIIFDRCANG